MVRNILFVLISSLVVPGVALAQPKAPTTAPATAPAAAKAGPGTTAVKQANTTISALLKQKAAPGSKEEKELAAKVTTSVRGFLDIDQLGKRAMVDQWSKLSKDQQQQFLALLRDLIETHYVRGLRANLQYTVDYAGETTAKDGNVLVTTKVNTQRRGRPFSIDVQYLLVKDGDKLRAFDVITDGVGLVENYRTMFNKVITKDGFAGLMDRMKKKQAEAAAPAKT
ncbi:MAG: ABC transporter substrate-binding protein [Myxococcota bacterium]|nr:ABC transporter substrate-binding protein [Myxococcota bacterium]